MDIRIEDILKIEEALYLDTICDHKLDAKEKEYYKVVCNWERQFRNENWERQSRNEVK